MYPGTFSDPYTVSGGIFYTDRYSSANGAFLSYEVIIHWNACGQYGEPGLNNTPSVFYATLFPFASSTCRCVASATYLLVAVNVY